MLLYYDQSRRHFLQILGVSTAGLLLPGCSTQSPATAMEAGPGHGEHSANDLMAAGLHDAGVEVVTCVPATGTAKIFDAFTAVASSTAPYSFNEEVAYTIAHGAALAGVRAATIIKAHGLAKACNSVVDSLTAGTIAGFTAVVTYDALGKHSDNIFDYTGFIKGSGIPFKPLGSENPYTAIQDCLLWSEQLQLPTALLVDSARLDETAMLPEMVLPKKTFSYSRDPYRHVLCPPLTTYQHQVLQAKRSGASWKKVQRPQKLHVPKSLPPKWRRLIKPYTPIFEAFAELRDQWEVVSGDTGISSMFAFEPYNCIDSTTYYGGSTPLALGALLAGRQGVWAVTGDYAFVAAGHLGLVEAASRELPLKLLILNNGAALTTGGQPIPPGLLERLLEGFSSSMHRVSQAMSKETLKSTLSAAAQSDRLEIIIADCV